MTIYSIVMTALFMALLVCLGYEHAGRIRAQDQALEAERDLISAREEITGYRIEKANRDGVEAGRQSDAVYKSFLSQFSAGEQVTVMLRRDDAKYYQPQK